MGRKYNRDQLNLQGIFDPQPVAGKKPVRNIG
jgi:hypothetical protein